MSERVRARRGWKWWLRTVHLYLSLCGLILLLFFGTTGFVMNHEGWFDLDASTDEAVIGDVPLEMLGEPDKLAVVELLRSRYGAVGEVRKFDVGDEELQVEFRKPGVTARAMIQRDDGSMTMKVQTSGMLKTLTLLHQGKNTGTLGGLVIDLASSTLILAALTGLTLWITLPSRRRLGLAGLVLGIVLFVSFCFYVI